MESMKVYDAGIGTKTRNKRGKTTGYNSHIISFVCEENITLSDYVKLEQDGNFHTFEVHAVNINDDSHFDVEAHEVGHWARFLNKKEGYDLRNLLDVPVYMIKEKDEISKIREKSGWL